MIKVWIHSNIAKLADGKMDWNFEPKSPETPLNEIFRSIFADEKHLLFGIIDETGAVRKHINIFNGSTNIKNIEGLNSPVKDNDEISIFTAVSGG
jgi:sulfur-carrier protein